MFIFYLWQTKKKKFYIIYYYYYYFLSQEVKMNTLTMLWNMEPPLQRCRRFLSSIPWLFISWYVTCQYNAWATYTKCWHWQFSLDLILKKFNLSLALSLSMSFSWLERKWLLFCSLFFSLFLNPTGHSPFVLLSPPKTLYRDFLIWKVLAAVLFLFSALSFLTLRIYET